MSTAGRVDAALTRPALVHGSLPPGGRDLDLLVEAADLGALRALGAPDLDLSVAADWDLPAGELAWLRSTARPLPPHTHLVRPAPAADLLLLALRDLAAGPLSQRHRERLRRALEDPAALPQARQRAAAWRVPVSLEALVAAVDGQPGTALRYRHARERQRRTGPPRLARVRAVRRALLPG